MFHGGSLKTKSIEIANCQNEFFIEKVKEVRKNLPPASEDPLVHAKKYMADKTCTMGFSAVHPDEVKKIISHLSNSASFGLDELDTYIIKLIKDQITPALTHIINLSLKTHVYPEGWKDSKAIPLYKKDDIFNPINC